MSIDIFGLTTLSFFGLMFSDVFFRIIVGIAVVTFAYINFGANNFLRNVIIVLSVVCGIGILFFGISFFLIIPRFIAGVISSIGQIPGIFF